MSECRNPDEVYAAFPKEEDIKAVHNLFQDIINAMHNLTDIWPFKYPVTAEEAPDYHDVIKDPIDLATIQTRLDTMQYYITQSIFFADIKRMLDNCKLYNNQDTTYYRCAVNVERALCEKGWGKYFQA